MKIKQKLMLIYNTTYLVAEKQFDVWIEWVRKTHVPFMLECGFSEPRIAKIFPVDRDQEEKSVSVQFHISDIRALNIWKDTFAGKLQKELDDRFGTDILSFSTIMEII